MALLATIAWALFSVYWGSVDAFRDALRQVGGVLAATAAGVRCGAEEGARLCECALLLQCSHTHDVCGRRRCMPCLRGHGG
jgi:hypothetical protein